MNILDFTIRLGLALLFGALIGFERQWRQKSAGLRTNALVSLGAAAFTLISFSITSQSDGVYKGDATRIIGQVVTGIGFLGGGVIFREGLNVQGLNTAATIWCSASVGCLTAVGLFAEASIATAAVMLSHLGLRPLGLYLNNLTFKNQGEEEGNFYYSFKIRCKEQVENHLRVLILDILKRDAHLQLRSLKSSDNGNPAYTYIEAEILANGKHDTEMEKLAAILTIEYGVTQVSWEVTGQQE